MKLSRLTAPAFLLSLPILHCPGNNASGGASPGEDHEQALSCFLTNERKIQIDCFLELTPQQRQTLYRQSQFFTGVQPRNLDRPDNPSQFLPQKGFIRDYFAHSPSNLVNDLVYFAQTTDPDQISAAFVGMDWNESTALKDKIADLAVQNFTLESLDYGNERQLVDLLKTHDAELALAIEKRLPLEWTDATVEDCLRHIVARNQARIFAFGERHLERRTSEDQISSSMWFAKNILPALIRHHGVEVLLLEQIPSDLTAQAEEFIERGDFNPNTSALQSWINDLPDHQALYALFETVRRFRKEGKSLQVYGVNAPSDLIRDYRSGKISNPSPLIEHINNAVQEVLEAYPESGIAAYNGKIHNDIETNENWGNYSFGKTVYGRDPRYVEIDIVNDANELRPLHPYEDDFILAKKSTLFSQHRPGVFCASKGSSSYTMIPLTPAPEISPILSLWLLNYRNHPETMNALSFSDLGFTAERSSEELARILIRNFAGQPWDRDGLASTLAIKKLSEKKAVQVLFEVETLDLNYARTIKWWLAMLESSPQ